MQLSLFDGLGTLTSSGYEVVKTFPTAKKESLRYYDTYTVLKNGVERLYIQDNHNNTYDVIAFNHNEKNKTAKEVLEILKEGNVRLLVKERGAHT